jgi:predicted transcriptional regulator
LSIKPEFADAIFSGTKDFEFRRTIFRSDSVDRVVVYASAPVSQVVGVFAIEDLLCLSVHALWNETKHAAGIDRRRFLQYFAGRRVGHALRIGRRLRFQQPLDLAHFAVRRAPQSFVYLASGPHADALPGRGRGRGVQAARAAPGLPLPS